MLMFHHEHTEKPWALEEALHKLLYIKKLNDADEIPFELLLLADETMEAIYKYLNSSEVYVAKCRSLLELIAVFVLQKTGVADIEIKNIAVNERFQGMGIGSFLIDKIGEMTSGWGARALWVGTPDSAQAQLNFYLKNGFRIAGVRKDFYVRNYPEPIYEHGVRLRDMVMLKKLI